ncbi:MAG: class I SAM-dependent methyltransferase [Oceanicoccus sp.]
MTEKPANADQIEFWNSAAGEQWVKGQETMDRTLAGFGQLAIAALAPKSGEAILDVGCGCGATSIALMETMGNGNVLGVDISAPMLARAEQRTIKLGLDSVKFRKADAASFDFEANTLDGVFSRFGVMFFDDAVAAFANIRSGLKPGGRLSFVCWRPISDNQWTLVPMMAAFEHIERPNAPPAGAPGPFAFGDKDRTKKMLEEAGFNNVSIEAKNLPMAFSITSDKPLGLQFAEMGPVGRLLINAPDDKKTAIVDSMTSALEPFVQGDQAVLDGAVWLVTATNAQH